MYLKSNVHAFANQSRPHPHWFMLASYWAVTFALAAVWKLCASFSWSFDGSPAPTVGVCGSATA